MDKVISGIGREPYAEFNRMMENAANDEKEKRRKLYLYK